MSSSGQRLPRLLALIPYLLNRPGIAISTAARDFEVTERQLRKDLELLWMCGLPGYGPGDLIDLSFDGDTVLVTYDAGMRRPLRLTGGEASALVVALQALAEIPGALGESGDADRDEFEDVPDVAAVHRAIAKIETAVGIAHSSHVVVEHDGDDERTACMRATVQRALRTDRALWLRYYTASRDQITERTVDPVQLLIMQAFGYLEAWCRRAEATRLFRLDRIDDIIILADSSDPPHPISRNNLSHGVFSPQSEFPEAVLVLAPEARWVAEYYPCEEVADLEDGRLRVRIRYGDELWMVRFVLQLGGQATVEQPAELAHTVRERAAQALELMTRIPPELNQ